MWCRHRGLFLSLAIRIVVANFQQVIYFYCYSFKDVGAFFLLLCSFFPVDFTSISVCGDCGRGGEFCLGAFDFTACMHFLSVGLLAIGSSVQ